MKLTTNSVTLYGRCLGRHFGLHSTHTTAAGHVAIKRPKHTASAADLKQPNRPPVRGYDQLFPWKSMKAFGQCLADNIVYFDGKLLAISKPWGVGIHKASVTVRDSNSYLALKSHHGSPSYSLMEAMEPLTQILDVPKLFLVKAIDRYSSGIVLLATDEPTVDRALKALRRSAAMSAPAMKYLCVTKGWPTHDGHELTERVGIKLMEVDELGDHKHPVIIPSGQLTTSMRCRQNPQSDGMVVKPVLCRLRSLDVNRGLGVGLVELSTNITKYSFIECYLAFKTAFVLGDNRFSRQVKHIMGTPLTIKPNRLLFSQDMEPLPANILRKLDVRSNSDIPVQIHHHQITLPLYLNKKDKKDLVIQCPTLPDYFEWTLKRLDLRRPAITAGTDQTSDP